MQNLFSVQLVKHYNQIVNKTTQKIQYATQKINIYYI